MLINFLFIQSLFYLRVLSLEIIEQSTKNLDSYTNDEIELLPQLRERVKNDVTQQYMLENKYLIRFLRAGHWNVDKTEKLMRENFQWRETHQVDKLFFQNISSSVFTKRIPFFFVSGRDQRPAVIGSIGGIDVRHTIIKGKTDSLRRYFIYGAERIVWDLHLTANRTGLEITGEDLVVNLAGFSYLKHVCRACLPLLFELVYSYERYYPQLIQRIVVINSSRRASRLFQLLKPLASAYSVQNLQIYDVDKSDWQPKLLKLFNKENLPLEFGGTAPSQQLYRITPEHLTIQLGPQAKTEWLAYQ